MDGTLFGTQAYAIDRTALIPASGEVLDGTWARKVAIQQLRAFGFAGRTPATMAAQGALTTGGVSSVPSQMYMARATIALPFNAYGIARPPMIFGMTQYGSVIVYKQFQDEGPVLAKNRAWSVNTPNNSEIQPDIFRTWIDDLHYDSVTIGGVAGYRWSFSIVHRALVKSYAEIFPQRYYPSPYADLINSWYPIGTDAGIAGTGYVWLHWYALGVDTSTQL